MTSIAIMQPTFLPWVGYFALIDSVDKFVFLDHVQFDKRSWQQRNRIKTANGPLWLSVPVSTKGHRDQQIKDAKINAESADFPSKIIKTIEHNYKKSPFYDQYAEDLYSHLRENTGSLSDLNISLIKFFCDKIGVSSNISLSSDLSVSGQKSALLVDICKHYEADHYVSPPGSQEYIEAEGNFKEAGIAVSYFGYDHPEWSQLYSGFDPYMSVIDLLFNMGGESLKIIQKGITQ